MSNIRQTPNSNVQTVSINYTTPAAGQNPQLQVFNSPGGSNTQIQFNNGDGRFGGSPNMIWNNANRILNVLGTVRASNLQGRIVTNTVNFKLTGGNAGDTITTDGTGNLTWVEGENYSNINVAAYLGAYTGNLSGSNTTISNTIYTHNISATGTAFFTNVNVNGSMSTRSINANGNLTAHYFIGNGSTLTSINGSNVTGIVENASYAAEADVANTANTANVAEIANVANSVSIANVEGIGNIAEINLDDDANNVLYGNGVFAPVGAAQLANGVNIIELDSTYCEVSFNQNDDFLGTLGFGAVSTDMLITAANGNITLNANSGFQSWDFNTNGTFYTAGNIDLFVGSSLNLTVGNVSSDPTNLFVETDVNTNFKVITKDSGGGESHWTFDSIGNLLTPAGGKIGLTDGGSGNNLGITSGEDGYVVVHSNDIKQYLQIDNYGINISTDWGNANNLWSFDLSGKLTVPGNIVPDTSNVYDLGNNTNRFKDLWLSGNTIYIGNSTIEVQGNSINFSNTESLTVNEVVFTDGSIISNSGFTAGPNQNAVISQFDGNTQVYTMQSGVGIQTYDTDYRTWTFNSNGELSVPGNINFGGDPSAAPSLNDFFSVTSAANFSIVADNANTGQVWNFGSDGLLTLPGGNVVIGLQLGGQAIISNNEPLGIVSQGNAGTVLQWSDDLTNTSSMSGIYINGPFGNIGDIQLVTGDVTGPNVWTFGADGVLTVPGDISGTGSSPAPSLFGFDSLDAISINASGNMSAQYFLGNGSQLTGLPATYSNTNVAEYLPTYGGNISANYFIGNGSLLTGLPASYSNTNVAAYLPTYTGNITGNYILGNGSLLTGLGNITTVNLDGNASNILYGNGSFASAPSGGSYGNSNVVTLLSSFGSNTITTSGNMTAGNISVSGYFISGNQATGGFQLGNSNSRLKAGDSNSYMTMGQNPAIYPDTAASATAGVLIGGSGYLLGNNGARNITLNYGGSSGIVGLQSNVQVGTGGSGTVLVPGTVTTGVNSILAGPTFTPLPNTMAGFVSNVNSYTQLTIQNKSTGADATADFIATADNGSDTVNYLDLGIINSGYDANTPTNSLGNIVFAADSYLYAQGNTGNTSQSGGNLAIGTTVAGKSVKIFAGGANNNSIVATISNTGANITGNLTLSGNIIGSSPNVSLVAGSYTATFDNTGKLNLPSMGGDEGGEINFGIPTSNTTLTTRVVFDVFQDRVRFFDGSTKGAYIDLSQAATGVNTLLNNRVSGYVNAGVFVTMDNLKATVTTSGNRSLALATVSGSFGAYVSGVYAILGGGSAGTGASVTITTSTGNTPIIAWNFAGAGDTVTYIVNDTTNSRTYRITMMIGGSYNNNMISIERLI
jgi:hypothetical protein